jgi:hypothetical protein
MYGLILQNVAEYIQVKHGMDKWIMVKEHLNLDWVCTDMIHSTIRRECPFKKEMNIQVDQGHGVYITS